MTSVITKFLKLPFVFDSKKLEQDLRHILEKKWVSHFNTDGYKGSWKSVALYSQDGDSSKITVASNTDEVNLKETDIIEGCRYLKNVLSTFKCPFLSVRLLKLAPNSYIKPHKDYNLGYEDGCFRLHIPILTNNNVDFILDNNYIKMKAGECWYTNVNYMHSVSNKGETSRIHLVIDGKRNSWSDDLFFSLASKESFLTKQSVEYSKETIKKIIQELKQNNSPASENLIREFEDKLKA